MPTDLLNLVLVGKLQKEYEILGKKVTLCTLTSDEIVTALERSYRVDPIGRLVASKIEFLLKSIKFIDGRPFFGGESAHFENEEKAREFLGSLQREVLDKFYGCFSQLTEEKNQTVGELKNEQGTPSYA